MTNECAAENLVYSKAYDNMFIPERFMRRVTDHIILNYLEDNHFFQPPLYLVIEGSPGQGKTMQTIAACNKKGIAVKYISASQLSGKKEGESREALQKVYNEALELLYSGIYPCILIDDFHMGNATTDEKVNKTINSNLLIGYMMNLAEAIPKQRIPIILTGNDFSKVYPALIRDGRADIFFWEPTSDEKYETVKSLYGSILLDRDTGNFKKFFLKYQDCNVAFFAQLINDLRRKQLSDQIAQIDSVSTTSIKYLSQSIRMHLDKITLSQLDELATQRKKDRERKLEKKWRM
ncbi:AAA family ATPase [Anaeromassilibacillus sp. An250]|uniref:AAA family ATPase n=1 Tax=Anaeromassilibacillus sp. An250 TaxID=1965604 RepID=UPI000B39702B|nr:AAA family ATPase [Anaeromassilibacillus sp. An250]OUO73130.1 hypothetical protein B5F54_12105 [Anaeromassilibacillus sp. An250]